MAETAEKIVKAVEKAQEFSVMQDIIYRIDHPSPKRHEFLFFIKPEVTLRDEKIRLTDILNLVSGKMNDFHFEIREIRLLGAAYLEKYNIIARHYGVINAMSSNALKNLTPEGRDKFASTFGKPPEQVSIAGGLEFLEQYKEFDPVTLDELWQRSKAAKLAGGTYCAPVWVRSEQVYLVNGFHPKQLIHFTEKSRSIVAFYLASDIDWSDARNKFIGKTNPEDAEPGSLRFELLRHQSDFGLEAVNSSRNGFHLSAGPLEGLVELTRYCSDYSTGEIKEVQDFQFGQQLRSVFTDNIIRKFCDNAYVIANGSKISAFDLTEEKNADVALQILGTARLH